MTEQDKARVDTLRQEREALYQEHKSDFEFVDLIAKKAELKIGRILLVAAIAFVVMVGVTWGLYSLRMNVEDFKTLSPMWVWATAGIPAIAATVYTIVAIGRHERFTDYHRQLVADMGDVSMKLFEYDQEIEKLEQAQEEE